MLNQLNPGDFVLEDRGGFDMSDSVGTMQATLGIPTCLYKGEITAQCIRNLKRLEQLPMSESTWTESLAMSDKSILFLRTFFQLIFITARNGDAPLIDILFVPVVH